MRRYGFLILSLAAALLLAGPAVQGALQAQDPAQGELETIEQIDQAAGLTDQQKEQLKQVRESHVAQIRAIQQDSSLTARQKAQKIKEVNQSYSGQVRGVLTPEQYERWQRRHRDRVEDRFDRREDRRDRREDVRDRREDVRDARHDGGLRDRLEDRRDRREDVRDRREDVRDRREDRRDRRRRP